MPSLLKKNSEKTKTLQVPAWHTNFRNFAVLPDTKLVRTSFFVNGLLVVIALATVMAFTYQEYTLGVVRSQYADLKQQIDKNKPASDRAIALYKQFQAEELKVNDLKTFLKGPRTALSDLIIRLSLTKPAGVAFIGFDYKEAGASIKGYAQGISEQATGAASAYEKQLKEDTQINAIYKTISMTNVSRDIQAGRLMFDIVLSTTAPKSR